MTTATNPTPDQSARAELRANGLWRVAYALAAAREVVTTWRRLNTEGPNTPDDLELALDNATVELEDALFRLDTGR